MTNATTIVCEICKRKGDEDTHMCRFENGCKCWYGTPCETVFDQPSIDERMKAQYAGWKR